MEGQESFVHSYDNSSLLEGARRSTEAINNIGKTAVSEGQKIDAAFKKIGAAVGAYFTYQQVKEFGNSILKVRKEIESLEISFRTLLGSEEKAATLLREIKTFAVSTPMQMKDLASGAQTMLGFGIEADKVMTYLKQLGDISMGDSEKFKSLTLAFSQATAAGKLQGQDLLQLINAGFNPLNEIAKKTGKSIGQLKDDMSKGAIGADQLADALKSATSEGGTFFKMLENQSKSIQGAISNLQGAWDDMLNDLGEQNQEMFTDIVLGLTDVVKNYEKYISVIAALAATYGTYKTILMATVVIEQSRRIADNIRLIIWFRKELGLLGAAQQAFNITASANPYAILAGAITSVVAILGAYYVKTRVLTDAKDILNKKTRASAKEYDNEKSSIESLIATLEDETKSEVERQEALEKLQTVQTKYLTGVNGIYQHYKTYKDYVDKATEAQKAFNDELDRTSLNSKQQLILQHTEQQNLLTQLLQIQQKVNKGESVTSGSVLRQALPKEINDLLNMRSTNVGDVIKSVREKVWETQKAINAKSNAENALKNAKENNTSVTYGSAYETAKKEWEKAKQKLSEIAKDRNKYTEKQYKDAVEAEKKAEETYKGLGGDTTGKKTKEAQELAKDTADYKREMAKRVDAEKLARQQLKEEAQKAIVDRVTVSPEAWEEYLKEMEDARKRIAAIDSEIEARTEKANAVLGKLNSSSIEDVQQALDTLQSKLADVNTGTDEWKALDANVSNLKKTLADKMSANVDVQPLDKLKSKAEEVKDALTDLNNLSMADLKKEIGKLNEDITLSDILGTDNREEAKLQFQHQQQLNELERRKAEYLQSKKDEAKSAFDSNPNNKKTNAIFDDSTVQLTKEEEDAFKQMYDNLKKTQEAEMLSLQIDAKRAMREYLANFGSYAQQIQAISELYDEKIKNAKSEGEKLSLVADREGEIRGVKEKFGVELGAFADLFKQTSKKSVKELQKIYDKYQKLLKFLKEGGALGKETSIKTIDLKDAGFSDADLESIKSGQINIDQLESSVNSLGDSLNNCKGLTGEFSKGIKSMGGGDIGGGIEGISKAARQAGKDLKEIVDELGDIFGFDTSDFDAVMKGLDGIGEIGEGVGKFYSGDYLGGIMSCAKGITSIIGSIVDLIGHDKKLQKLIDENNKKLKTMDRIYKNMEKTIEKTYSRVKIDNIDKQIEGLKYQAYLIEQNIRLEEDKKKTDDSKIDEWKEKLLDIQEDIVDLQTQAVDAIFGEDVNTAIENFANAYVEAWGSGESKVKSVRDTVRDMMKQMVSESIKAALESSEGIKKIRQKLQEFYQDNVLTVAEQNYVTDMADKVAADLESQFGWADSLMKSQSETTSGSSSGFATASQESIDELSGRFLAVQINTNTIADAMESVKLLAQEQAEHLASVRENTEQSVNIGLEAINILGSIEKNTRELYQMNERLDKIEQNTRNI